MSLGPAASHLSPLSSSIQSVLTCSLCFGIKGGRHPPCKPLHFWGGKLRDSETSSTYCLFSLIIFYWLEVVSLGVTAICAQGLLLAQESLLFQESLLMVLGGPHMMPRSVEPTSAVCLICFTILRTPVTYSFQLSNYWKPVSRKLLGPGLAAHPDQWGFLLLGT